MLFVIFSNICIFIFFFSLILPNPFSCTTMNTHNIFCFSFAFYNNVRAPANTKCADMTSDCRAISYVIKRAAHYSCDSPIPVPHIQFPSSSDRAPAPSVRRRRGHMPPIFPSCAPAPTLRRRHGSTCLQ